MPLPTTPDLRSNRGTWAVPLGKVPAVANAMTELLPQEFYDADFRGQSLDTTYFDTAAWNLRKARLRKGKYLTLRVRCYSNDYSEELYALSAKTESEKLRIEIPRDQAEDILVGENSRLHVEQFLPANLQARLMELAEDQELYPVVRIGCRRYAVEDEGDRLTLDTEIRTSLGKAMQFAVLEFKSSASAPVPDRLVRLGLAPTKLSKFLWATDV